MTFAGGEPDSGRLARRKNRDAWDANGGGEGHRAGVIADKECASLQPGSRGSHIERASRVVTAAPLREQPLADDTVFFAAEDDRPDVELLDKNDNTHLSHRARPRAAD